MRGLCSPLTRRTGLSTRLQENRTHPACGHSPHLLGCLEADVGKRWRRESRDFPLNGIVALEEVDGKWLERWRLNRGLVLGFGEFKALA